MPDMAKGRSNSVRTDRAALGRCVRITCPRLAPLITKEIFRIISELRKTGVATLLIEQNARAALQVADFGYVLETGDIALEGNAADLARDPKVIETYLGLGQSGVAGKGRSISVRETAADFPASLAGTCPQPT